MTVNLIQIYITVWIEIVCALPEYIVCLCAFHVKGGTYGDADVEYVKPYSNE